VKITLFSFTFLNFKLIYCGKDVKRRRVGENFMEKITNAINIEWVVAIFFVFLSPFNHKRHNRVVNRDDEYFNSVSKEKNPFKLNRLANQTEEELKLHNVTRKISINLERKNLLKKPTNLMLILLILFLIFGFVNYFFTMQRS
jgi:hypothetical protein